MAGRAPEISLGQKYLTTADPFDPNYNTPDLHRDLKKLTCPSTILIRYIFGLSIDFNIDLPAAQSRFVVFGSKRSGTSSFQPVGRIFDSVEEEIRNIKCVVIPPLFPSIESPSGT